MLFLIGYRPRSFYCHRFPSRDPFSIKVSATIKKRALKEASEASELYLFLCSGFFFWRVERNGFAIYDGMRWDGMGWIYQVPFESDRRFLKGFLAVEQASRERVRLVDVFNYSVDYDHIVLRL